MLLDVIVVGAGASGLMCAIEAGKRGKSVLVVEHTGTMGSKILISGGGRCNFTNSSVSRENYLSANPHFATSALSRFTPKDFISLLDKYGVGYHVRDRGRLFCAESSRTIIDLLRRECDIASVQFLFDCKVSEVCKDGKFYVSTNHGILSSRSLVIASGGLSAPGIGATNFGYKIAKQFGMRVTALRPALTPLRFESKDSQVFGTLSGISIDAAVSYGRASFRDDILFTHKGLSGPAILQVSSYWEEGGTISIDLLPEVDILGVLMKNRHRKMLLSTILAQHLPERLVKVWFDAQLKSLPLNQYSTKEIEYISKRLHGWLVSPRCKEGFNKAEVTLGGIDTEELSSKTMESKKVPGLYFAGELIDVTGQLGGYNLHWAWASGYAAGRHV